MEPHTQFGIDEVYLHSGFPQLLLGKLQQCAALCLDAEDTIVHNNVSGDMVLVFRKRVQSKNMLYRYLEFINRYPDRERYLEENTLINEDELLEAVKTKTFVLVTSKILPKEFYSPEA